ncbi:MAG: beta-ketoacyl-ACP synthase II [SAR202 cluster bacterium]|jgi:beta-ketoacyl-acyl-carrier-protein synthase II|nr:beta-ketoacyl-ACP synthase II [SAR202 cluster bacterium]
MERRVVVTGIGIVSPVGLTRDTTWTNLLAGTSGIGYISSFDAEEFETTIAGEADGFDPTNYVGRKQARRMDRYVQLGVAATLEAVEHSGLKITPENAERVAVIVSSGIGGIITMSEQVGVLNEKGPSRVSPFLVPMMLPDMASGQISMLLGAKGPNFTTVSACSSGADAIGVALDLIRSGRADIALAGGCEAAICPIGIAGFNSCKALSKNNSDPQKASRPFDTERDGFVMGEGGAVLVLETMKSAIDRGATPIAELTGYGPTADAYHITQPAPEGEGGARAMKIALADAGISPNDIDYINAHGTSTVLNDKNETMAMKSVFGDHARTVAISSTKSMTGHLLGASGSLEAALSTMVIERGQVPPTINLDIPDADCDLDYTANAAKSISAETVMTNSFGFGGHNSSLIFRKPQDGAA